MKKSLFEIIGMLTVCFFFWKKKPSQKLILFVFGAICFLFLVLIDLFPVRFWGRPYWRSFFAILAPLVLLPLPSLLRRSRFGKILWPFIALVVLSKLLHTPFFYLFLREPPPLAQPADFSLLDTQGDRMGNLLVIKQSTPYSCTAACFSSMLTDFGHKMTERDAAILLKTSTLGTFHETALECLKTQFLDLEVRHLPWKEVRWNESWISLASTDLVTLASQVYHSVLIYPCPKGTLVKIKVPDPITKKTNIVDYVCETDMLAVGDPRSSHTRLFNKKQFEEYYKPQPEWEVIQVRKKADQSIPALQSEKIPLVLFKK